MSQPPLTEEQSPWETFQLNPSDPVDVQFVKKKTKQMLLLYHPDRTGNKQFSDEITKIINAACEVLTNDKYRDAYLGMDKRLKRNGWAGVSEAKKIEYAASSRAEEDAFRKKEGLPSMDEELAANIAKLNEQCRPKKKVPPTRPTPRQGFSQPHRPSKEQHQNAENKDDSSDTDYEESSDDKAERERKSWQWKNDREKRWRKEEAQRRKDEQDLRDLEERRKAEEKKLREEENRKKQSRSERFGCTGNADGAKYASKESRDDSADWQRQPTEAEIRIQFQQQIINDQWEQMQKLRAKNEKHIENEWQLIRREKDILQQKGLMVNARTAEIAQKENEIKLRQEYLQDMTTQLHREEKELSAKREHLLARQDQLNIDQDTHNECKWQLNEQAVANEKNAAENLRVNSELNVQKDKILQDKNTLEEEWKKLEQKEIDLDSREQSIYKMEHLREDISSQPTSVPLRIETGIQTEYIFNLTDSKTQTYSTQIVDSETQTNNCVVKNGESQTKYYMFKNSETQTSEYSAVNSETQTQNSGCQSLQTQTEFQTTDNGIQTIYRKIDAETQYEESEQPVELVFTNSSQELEGANNQVPIEVPSTSTGHASTRHGQSQSKTPQRNKIAVQKKSESLMNSRSKQKTEKRARSTSSSSKLVTCGIGGCDKKLNYKSMFNHRQSHKEHPCEHCDKIFTRPDNVYKHMAKRHPMENMRRLEEAGRRPQ